MFKQFGVSTNEIYQEGFLKVHVLKRSTKGATLRKEQRPAPFVEHPAHGLLSAESEQNKRLMKFGGSTNEIYQKGFLKVAVLYRSTKGAKTSSFCRPHS